MTPLEALEIIKNAGTIYVGCASNIYTRYSFECKEIEKALKVLEIIKEFGVLETYTLTVRIPVCKLTETGVESDEENLKKLKLLKEVLL